MTVNDHSLRREAVQKVFNVILNEVKNLILSLNREILLSLRSIRMTVIKLFGQPRRTSSEIPAIWIPAYAGITMLGLIAKLATRR